MKVRKTVVRGSERWMVDLGVQSGKRRRRFFATEAQANEECRRSLKQAGLWTKLPLHLRVELMAILKEMEAEGVTLREVWDSYRMQKPEVATPSHPLRDAVVELVKAKTAAGRRSKYVEALESYLLRFSRGREAARVDRIQAQDIVSWFADSGEAPSTRQVNQNRLRTLFEFCRARGWLEKNPVDLVDRVSVDRSPPTILSTEQAATLLRTCRTTFLGLLAYVVLGLLAGIRPEELLKLDWGSVDLERGRVTIDAEVSKVRRQRIIELEPACLAWLAVCRRGGPIWKGSFTTFRRERRRLAAAVGIRWQADILRHTYGSYALALHRDPTRVAWTMGNSVSVLLSRYKALVTPEDAAVFWAMRP